MSDEDFKMWCYFAGMAMQGVLASGSKSKPDVISTKAFAMADSMMKERDKGKEKTDDE
jgi:hypothetical protein